MTVLFTTNFEVIGSVWFSCKIILELLKQCLPEAFLKSGPEPLTSFCMLLQEARKPVQWLINETYSFFQQVHPITLAPRFLAGSTSCTFFRAIRKLLEYVLYSNYEDSIIYLSYKYINNVHLQCVMYSFTHSTNVELFNLNIVLPLFIGLFSYYMHPNKETELQKGKIICSRL